MRSSLDLVLILLVAGLAGQLSAPAPTRLRPSALADVTFPLETPKRYAGWDGFEGRYPM